MLLLSSCKIQKLEGSWEFIEVYDKVLNNVDTLKNKENHSKAGTGTLIFHNNGSFEVMENKGSYWNKKNVLKMKYSQNKDTIVMKISYVSRDHLLLSDEKKPTTWFYRRK
ncbi:MULTISPECIES: hypothetical protein [Chryseobacterium]|uniref:hypothetical protein n=1 Tax=Chryseobacterium TaxID=59732 RepID=UPI0016231B89|nr:MULTISPECIES: hypothetical protein [Chryseobacterium]MDR6923879.1 hypothetical protein [Chryseobacterium sp. 2987]